MYVLNFFLFVLLIVLLQGRWGSVEVWAVLYAPEYHGYWPGHWMGPPSAPIRDVASGKIDFYAECNANVSALNTQSSQGWYHFSSVNYSTWYRDNFSPLLGQHWWYNQEGTLAGSASFNSDGEEVVVYTCTGSDGKNRICQSTASTTVRSNQGLVTILSQSTLNPIFPSAATFETGPLAPGSSWNCPSRFWSIKNSSPNVWYLNAIATDINGSAMVGVFSTTDPLLLDGITYGSVMYRDGNFSRFGTPEFVDLTSSTATLTPVPSSSSFTYLLKLTMVNAKRDYVVYGKLSFSNATGLPEFVEDASHPPTWVDLGTFQEAKVFTDSVTRTQRVVGYLPEDLVDPVAQAAQQKWSGALSIPRVIRYDATEQRIAFAPMPEIKSIRQGKLYENVGSPFTFSSTNETTSINDNGEIFMKSLELSAIPSAHHEIVVRFELPEGWMSTSVEGEDAPEVGILLRATANFSFYTRVAVEMPTTDSCPSAGGLLFRQIQLRGAFNDKDLSGCQGLCTENSMCEKWKVVLRPYGMDCHLYTAVEDSESEEGICGTQFACPTSSPYLVLDRSQSGTVGNSSTLRGRVALRTSQPQLLELRVFVDNSILEVFKDDGLETLSGRVYVPEDQNGMAIYAKNLKGGTNISAIVQVFSMDSMWALDGETMEPELIFQEINSMTKGVSGLMRSMTY